MEQFRFLRKSIYAELIVKSPIYMNARYYVPTLNRFLTPDTIVPDSTNPQSFNRYSYGYNNPVKYIDPTGHVAECGAASGSCGGEFPGGWDIPETDVLVQLAQTYDIPPELLGALLQVIQAVDYDSQDKVEDFIASATAVNTMTHPPLNIVGKLGIRLMPGNVSPGLSQMQLRRAEQMEGWLFNDNNTIDSSYDLMRDTLGTSNDKADRILRLMNTEIAAAYTAAHVRWLMEEEFGPQISAVDLCDEEIALIISQYKAAPRSDPVYGISDYRDNRFGVLAVEAKFISAWKIRTGE